MITGYEPNILQVNCTVYLQRQRQRQRFKQAKLFTFDTYKIVTLQSGWHVRMEENNPIPSNQPVQQPIQQVQGTWQLVPLHAHQGILLSLWDGNIDLSTKTRKLLWNKGIKPLKNKLSGKARDLTRFLANITNRAKKCKWLSLLTIKGKSFLSPKGDILLEKTVRDNINPTTLAEVKPKVSALMMFHFPYNSIGATPQKKLTVCTKLGVMDLDGPLL